MRTVLVVDDEARIVQLARDYLEHAGFAVLTAADGPSALETVRRRHPDLVVLDIGLPGLDGLDVTRELRRDSAIPIVMLTARDDELDKLLGLELGADDYLTKPFSPRELVARVKAVLRRTEGATAPGDVIRAGDVVLDVPRMRAEVAGRAVDLTATEFGLLATMAASPAGSSRARSSSTPSAASPSSRTSGRSTPTSRTCAARSSRTRASPATSSPSTAWATGSPTTAGPPG